VRTEKRRENVENGYPSTGSKTSSVVIAIAARSDR
jgi:hypothetical protein